MVAIPVSACLDQFHDQVAELAAGIKVDGARFGLTGMPYAKNNRESPLNHSGRFLLQVIDCIGNVTNSFASAFQ